MNSTATPAKSFAFIFKALASAGWRPMRRGPQRERYIRIEGEAAKCEALAERMQSYGWTVDVHDGGASIFKA